MDYQCTHKIMEEDDPVYTGHKIIGCIRLCIREVSYTER